MAFVRKVFQTGEVQVEINRSVICMLHKQQYPEDMSQFRPICLSNLIIKIVNKVIANRVKRVIGDLVGGYQASFISGRQTTDNIVIAQEVLHSLRSNKSKRGRMIVKIDVEKAYDCVDWYFLDSVLRAIGFWETLIKVIRACVLIFGGYS